MNKRKCKYCGKEITGFTKGQLDNMFINHMLSKHRDTKEFKEIKELLSKLK